MSVLSIFTTFMSVVCDKCNALFRRTVPHVQLYAGNRYVLLKSVLRRIVVLNLQHVARGGFIVIVVVKFIVVDVSRSRPMSEREYVILVLLLTHKHCLLPVFIDKTTALLVALKSWERQVRDKRSRTPEDPGSPIIVVTVYFDNLSRM